MFGGNKSEITIFGESAGGMAVSAMIISPLTKGLFKRAIIESGVIMYNLGKALILLNKTLTLLLANELSKSVDCMDSKQWLECLRRVDAKELVIKDNTLLFPLNGTEFLPFITQKSFAEQMVNKGIVI